MATYVPPQKNAALVFYTALTDASDTTLLKANPTLADGDAKVSIDGGAFANLATLPDVYPAGGYAVRVQLSAAENSGDNVVVYLHDAVGTEWCDQLINIQTVASQIDDLATQASVDTVDGNVDSILVDTGTDIPASIAALNDLSAAEAQAAAAAAIVAADVATGAEVAAAEAAIRGADGDTLETLSDEIAALNDLSAEDAADAVWDELVADHVGAGSFGEILGDVDAEVWSYSSRTLTQSAASVASAVAGGVITITRGDSLSASLTDIGALTGYVSLDFTVKRSKDDTDDDAILRIRLNATGTDDGLITINKVSSGLTAANGSITIDDAATGNITIALAAEETDDLVAYSGYFYDVQMITATAVTTLTEGVCNVVLDVTRAVV